MAEDAGLVLKRVQQFLEQRRLARMRAQNDERLGKRRSLRLSISQVSVAFTALLDSRLGQHHIPACQVHLLFKTGAGVIYNSGAYWPSICRSCSIQHENLCLTRFYFQFCKKLATRCEASDSEL